MSEKITDKITKYETDMAEYLQLKFKDMPAESAMEFVAFLGDKTRCLINDIVLDTQQKCIREFKRANKVTYRPRYKNVEEKTEPKFRPPAVRK